MKLVFATRDKPPTGHEVLNLGITAKCVQPPAPTAKRRRLAVTKVSRLVTIDFACSLDLEGKFVGYLSLTEAEILLLAGLCRRNRTDADFLKAIESAGEGVTDIPKTRSRELEPG